MKNTLFARYPRTLYEWLKKDDKLLQTAIADGKTVFEVADELQREPVSVLSRLDTLDVCPFVSGTEEWVEVMRLALAEVPLMFVISWCTAAPDRLPFEMFISFGSSDLSQEFALARQLNVIVANIDALEDLKWLACQPVEFQCIYEAACEALSDAFEVITPTTLRRQVTGLSAPPVVKNRQHLCGGTQSPRRGKRSTSPWKKKYRAKQGSSYRSRTLTKSLKTKQIA